MITVITFDEIFKVWATKLWPNRNSAIETHSAMLLSKSFDINNFNYPATYFAYVIDDMIVGCNSGHGCTDNSYRSRGLYVDESYRKQGIGSKLLQATINQAKLENYKMIWSYPRKTSWNTYQNVGFALLRDWEMSEVGENSYCARSI